MKCVEVNIYSFIKSNMKAKFACVCLSRVLLLLLLIPIEKLQNPLSKRIWTLKNSQWLEGKSCIWNFFERRSISQEFNTGSSKRAWSKSSSCPLGKEPCELAGRLPARLPHSPPTWWMASHLLIRSWRHGSFLSCSTQLNQPWWISNSPSCLQNSLPLKCAALQHTQNEMAAAHCPE